MRATWFTIALFNLGVAALLGVLLRYAFVEELSWLKFRHVMHAHAHTAMLGWVQLALYVLLARVFIPAPLLNKPGYARLLGLTQLSVWGMLVSFVVGGYGVPALVFWAFFTVLSYFWVYRFWRDFPPQLRTGWSGRMAALALGWLLVASLGVWAVALAIGLGAQGSLWHIMAVQFYLHFQFNGWFVFALLALLWRVLEEAGVALPAAVFRPFTWLLGVSAALTYALALSWAEPTLGIFLVNSLGVLLQLAAAVVLARWWQQTRPWLAARRPAWESFLLGLALLALALKVLMQTAVVVPYIATVAYTIRNFVIGFLHLLLLGGVTAFLWALASAVGWLRWGFLTRLGVVLFLLGVLGSEAVLFLQGALFWGAMGFLPGYYEVLFGVSTLMLAGIVAVLLGQYGVWR